MIAEEKILVGTLAELSEHFCKILQELREARKSSLLTVEDNKNILTSKFGIEQQMHKILEQKSNGCGMVFYIALDSNRNDDTNTINMKLASSYVRITESK